MNNEKMKAKCEAWIKEGMGACRAPVTYDELNNLIRENLKLQLELARCKSRHEKYRRDVKMSIPFILSGKK